jgi:hypothetical protein
VNPADDKLLDTWEPPAGAGPALACVATTFTFEPDFFETQCIGRFLALDTRPENDLAFLIEREERLAETTITVVADRRLDPETRSLRWDVLGALAPTGVMHAKLALMVWESAVRVLVTSANLTEGSYRERIETAIVFDATATSTVPRPVFDELLEEISRIIRLTPAASLADAPVKRALRSVAHARDVLDGLRLPARPRRGAPRLEVVATGRGQDALAQLERVWSGTRPTRVTVMSPFFDAGPGAARLAARLADLAARRNARVDLVVSVDQISDQEVARAPKRLIEAIPARLGPGVFDVRQPDPNDPRGLHAKVVLLESSSWIAALVGSSNATCPGLGIGTSGNVEVGVAIGAPADGELASALRALVLRGEEVALEDVEFEPIEDPDENRAPVPAAFVAALGEPGDPCRVRIELDPPALPPWWEIRTLEGTPLITSDDDPGPVVEVEVAELPFVVTVKWSDSDEQRQTGQLAVNVTDPAALPPPAELQNLPIEALLRALGSTRPLHESLPDEVRRHQEAEAAAASQSAELDALKRFSEAGLLMRRTKELSYALAGLRARLSAPAASLDAFRWRMTGPFGPREVAAGLLDRSKQAPALPGETSFTLAEIALTLADIDLDSVARHLDGDRAAVEEIRRQAIADLASLRDGVEDGAEIAAYVDAAFERALA